ncbi:type VII secretion integral membrane protein EccD [Streptomyces oceani]|uniref:type VII secretion integral membrane protein EccD n=1 Tax=Streptomyces oceani TaxID=1075402 RepID=UPI0008721C3F|nr:type VII secretion integral membrane protein EccD [Streptomyces oceani]
MSGTTQTGFPTAEGTDGALGTPPGNPPSGSQRERSSGSDFCRVVVAGPHSRADLALPLSVPLIRLMPALVQHAGVETGPDGGALHDGWVLRTGGGARLEASRSLGAQEIREGDILFLGHGSDDPVPPLYDDVVEALSVEGVRSPWSSTAVRRTAAAFAAVAVTGAAGALAVAPGTLPGYLGLVACLLGLGLAALLSRAFSDVAGGTCAAILASPLAAVGAARLLGAGPGDDAGFGAAHLLLAGAVLAVVGASGPVVVGGGDGSFAVLVVSGALSACGAFIATIGDIGAAQAASVMAPFALAVTTLWPALALRVAHLPGPQLASTAEELDQLPEPVEHETLRVRVDRARWLLTGMLAGSLVVMLGGALVLLASGEPWASVLAGVLGLLALLRARLFRDAVQVGTALAAGLAVLLGGAVLVVVRFTGETMPLLGAALPICSVVALTACAVGLLSGRRTQNPRLARVLDTVETMLLLALIPLVLAVWDVYTALLELKA